MKLRLDIRPLLCMFTFALALTGCSPRQAAPVTATVAPSPAAPTAVPATVTPVPTTPTPIPPTATPQLASAAGVGASLVERGWSVTITEVHVETQLSSFAGSFTPDDDDSVFLVVEYTVSAPDPSIDGKFSLYGTATNQDGERLAPDLIRIGSLGFGGLEEGKTAEIGFTSADEDPFVSALVFTLSHAEARGRFRIQFLELPSMTFTVEVE